MREATTSDAGEISTLLRELGYPLDPQTIAHNISVFPDTLSAAYVAELDERLVGVISVSVLPQFEAVGSHAKITSLFVRDDVRGRGAGRELVARAEAYAWSRGCEQIWVGAEVKPGTQIYYEALGYRREDDRMIKDNPTPVS